MARTAQLASPSTRSAPPSLGTSSFRSPSKVYLPSSRLRSVARLFDESIDLTGICIQGNDCCHVILRGSNTGPNYSLTHVQDCVNKLQKAGLNARLMIDASHGNSEKKHERQLLVVQNGPFLRATRCEYVADGGSAVAEQLETAPTADNVIGIMIESNLVAGERRGTSQNSGIRLSEAFRLCPYRQTEYPSRGTGQPDLWPIRHGR